MAKVQGVCKNIDECSLAETREVQEVERSEQFVCSECGKPLTAPTRIGPTVDGGSKKKFIIAGVVVLVAVAGLGAGSYFAKFPSFLYGGSNVTIVEEPIEDPVDESEEKPSADSVTTVTPPVTPPQPTFLTFAYGRYTGDIKRGKAAGFGTMKYTSRTLISPYDSKKRYAEAGQSITGTWYDNKLDNGKLYDRNGSLIEIINIGRAE